MVIGRMSGTTTVLVLTTLHYNPLTQQYEENGTTILDISNPARPRIVAHIPNFEHRDEAPP